MVYNYRAISNQEEAHIDLHTDEAEETLDQYV